MSAPAVVTAPGKLMLSGEYAVLEGATALVAAVDARVRVSLVPGPKSGPRIAQRRGRRAEGDGDREIAALFPVLGNAAHGPSPQASRREPFRTEHSLGDVAEPGGPARETPEADEARRLAEAELGETEGALSIDVSALRSGDGGTRKLGLGSSAAAAAGAAACVVAAHGLEVEAERGRVLAWALAGHHAVAPEGSGADVAACVLGGVVRFLRAEPESARRLEWPGGLELRVVWTGVEARTSDFIQKVRAFEARDAVHFEALINRLSNEAERFADAFEAGRVAAIVEQAGRYGHAMEALGRAADAPIVERSLRRVAALAREAGGAAKPSGAGGGDVAVAFFPSPAAAERFERVAEAANMQILNLRVDPQGVSL